MFKKIMFWVKYKSIKTLDIQKIDMSVEQYNEGLKHVLMLDLDLLFQFFNNSDDIEIVGNEEKIKSLYKLQGDYGLIQHIASCSIVPRFGKWKAKNRMKYCEDLSHSINKSFYYSGFFLSNSPMRLKNLGNSLITVGLL